MAAPARTAADVRQLVASSPMRAHQVLAIMVCVGLNMLDGFDILVMSFTAPGVSAEWQLSGARLGWLFSAGLIGMAAGSLFLAPRADRFGRRTVVMAAVLLVTVGMALSSIASDFWQLCSLRGLTGIGIGGILAGANVLVTEYASDRWRNTASYLYTSGYSIGGTVGGAIAAVLIGRYGWRSAFGLGAAASFVMLPLSYWKLPESLDFLIMRRPPDALRKLNRLLTAMHQANIEALPETGAAAGLTHAAVARLFAAGLGRSTALIWLAFFFVMSGYYFVFSWTPKLLTGAGLSAQQGITSGVLLSLGGIGGTVLFAFIAKSFDVRRLASFCLVVSSGLMCAFAMTTSEVAASLLIGVGLGGMATSAMAGLYALTPSLYASDLRTTGMGWAIGIGRIGAILAPLGTGILVDRDWRAVSLYWIFAVTFLVSALALGSMVPAARRERVVREIG